MGCDDFDKYQKLVELKFPKHEKAFAKFSKELHSKDKTYVENFIKLGIMREVIGIQSRNEARKYATNRAMSAKDWQSDGAQNADA